MAIDWDALVGTPVTAIFGQPVTYTPFSGIRFTLAGNFTEGFAKQGSLDDGISMTTERPMLGVQLSAFPIGVPPQQGDELQTVNSGSGVLETFTVKEVQLDGQGGAILVLNFLRS